MKDKDKAAKKIIERAIKKVGGKKVTGQNRWNMTPAVRKLEKKGKK